VSQLTDDTNILLDYDPPDRSTSESELIHKYKLCAHEATLPGKKLFRGKDLKNNNVQTITAAWPRHS
jgi:hypothetical protein